MSEVVKAGSVRAKSSAASSSAIQRVRTIGYIVLGLQLTGFLVWSTLQFNRFALTGDYALYHQPWYLIAHGHLFAHDSVVDAPDIIPFARSNSEWMLWLTAPLYWLWPQHDVVQLWVQDTFIVVAEALAFTWICELVQRHQRKPVASCLAITGLILLIATPWIWWGLSFDFHMESISLPFLVLLARDLYNGRRRAWLWAILTMASGVQIAVDVAGVGLGGVLAGRRSRKPGALMAVLSVSYVATIVLLHMDVGAPVTSYYAYLAGAASYPSASLFAIIKGIALHPLLSLSAIWGKRIDLLANLMPGGLVGIGSAMVSPVLLVILLEDFLFPGLLFAEPTFQALGAYVLMPVGTVAVLCWLAARRRRIALGLAGLIVAQSLGWAIVWDPRIPHQWLRVSGATAATLASVESRIPASAEVFVSGGVSGRFSDRELVYTGISPRTYPVRGQEVWFVIAPMAGIEAAPTGMQMAMIEKLAGPLHARLIIHANGVWVFRWHPAPGVHTVTVPREPAWLEGWESPGVAGRAIMRGPVNAWHVTSTGSKGYVVDGLAWQEPAGWYRLTVTMSASAPVNLEMWDDTGWALLTRRTIPKTRGIESVTLLVNAAMAYTSPPYPGWGPFRADFYPNFPGQRLELRIWSPGGEHVSVYGARLGYPQGGR